MNLTIESMLIAMPEKRSSGCNSDDIYEHNTFQLSVAECVRGRSERELTVSLIEAIVIE